MHSLAKAKFDRSNLCIIITRICAEQKCRNRHWPSYSCSLALTSTARVVFHSVPSTHKPGHSNTVPNRQYYAKHNGCVQCPPACCV